MQSEGNSRGSRCVCLILDDEPSVRALLSAVLGRAGFESIEAADSAEAMALFKQHKERIRIVISDVHVPGPMSGLEFASYVQHSLPPVPVLMMSGFTDDERIAGFDYLQKPFLPSAILERIDRVVADRAAAVG